MPRCGVLLPRHSTTSHPTERRPHATNRISAVGQVDVPLARYGAAVHRRLCTTKHRAHHPEKRRCAPRQQRREPSRNRKRENHHRDTRHDAGQGARVDAPRHGDSGGPIVRFDADIQDHIRRADRCRCNGRDARCPSWLERKTAMKKTLMMVLLAVARIAAANVDAD